MPKEDRRYKYKAKAGSGSFEFFFDGFVITGAIIFNPVRYGLIGRNEPFIALLTHLEHNSVTPVVTYVDRKKFFMQAIHFSEIELPQMALGFDEFGKLDISVELNDHGKVFNLSEQFSCYKLIIDH
jgi:hypothetical protein